MIEKRKGKVLEEEPESVKTGDTCLVEVTPNEPIIVEAFAMIHQLGRLVVIDNNKIIAVGIIK